MGESPGLVLQKLLPAGNDETNLSQNPSHSLFLEPDYPADRERGVDERRERERETDREVRRQKSERVSVRERVR